MKRVMATMMSMACAIALARGAQADVADSSPTGFTVKIVTDIKAGPSAVYEAITSVGQWWSSDHSYSGSAANMSIDAKAGGCFCEKLPKGSVQHMTVVFADPGKLLRLRGGLGPLQTMAVIGAMEWKLTDSAGKTHLELTYQVGGYAPGGVDAVAKPVDFVLSEQVGRLKRLIETGKPDAPK